MAVLVNMHLEPHALVLEAHGVPFLLCPRDVQAAHHSLQLADHRAHTHVRAELKHLAGGHVPIPAVLLAMVGLSAAVGAGSVASVSTPAALWSKRGEVHVRRVISSVTAKHGLLLGMGWPVAVLAGRRVNCVGGLHLVELNVTVAL